MRSKGSRDVIRVTALGDGIAGKFYLTAVELLGMSQHRQSALVDRLPVDVHPRVILRRLLTAKWFWCGCRGGNRCKGRSLSSSQRGWNGRLSRSQCGSDE